MKFRLGNGSDSDSRNNLLKLNRAEAPRTTPAVESEPAETEKKLSASATPTYQSSADYLELKVRMHQRIIDEIKLSALEGMDRNELRSEIGEVITGLLSQETKPLNINERNRIIDDVIDELMGFGPLEPLLQDETISDILVNTPKEVFIERFGVIEETDVKFKDDEHLLRIIDRIVVKVGRRVDESNPLVDARLPDGSRVNAVVPPIALDGPLVSIRKFSKIPFDLGRMVEIGSMTQACADVLKGCVKCRLNLLISGGTGTGKTTLLNAVSRSIGDKERIVTIEDAAELQLQQRHVARMETRPRNIEGKGEITQRDLVKNALRMRPDRIILGEVRGGEAFDMLQAMNTGHDGSMGTLHSNSPRECLSRLESMILMGGYNLPSKTIREMIVASVDVIIQASRMRDGSRKVTHITEVVGLEGDVITLQDIYIHETLGEDPNGRIEGRHRTTGIARPAFWDRAKYYNEEGRLAEALSAGEVLDDTGRPLGESYA